MLAVENLDVRYAATPVLRELNLALAPGLVHGLVGRNGAGKTTLLDAIYGFVRPHSGTIRFHGRPVLPDDVGYLPAELTFYRRITGREYLRIFHARNRTFDVAAWCGIFDLPLDRFVDEYSTGMKKKLALLGVLRLDRPVLVLDEPNNGLDLESNQLLGQLLRVWAERGRTVLVTSHVLESLTRTCDAIHLLGNGAIEGSYDAARFDRLEAQLLSAQMSHRLHTLRRLAAG